MDDPIRHALIDGERLGARYKWQVPQAAPVGVLGTRVGNRTGTSIDFQDYREYQPGDDIRFIDWNVYARTDRLTVKLFREEVTPHLDLILDGSRSMALSGTAKARAVARLAAVLATAAANAQCTCAVWLAANGCRRLGNDTLRPSAWTGLEFNSVRTVDEAFELVPPRLRRLGVRVLISDLLWPAVPERTVRRCSTGGAGLVVIQVLARADAEPPAPGGVRVVDVETEEVRDVVVDAAVARRYRDNLAQLQQAWAEACRKHGALLISTIAEDLEWSLAGVEAAGLLVPA